MSSRTSMTSFRLHEAPRDAPRSPEGTAARSRYEGPHGPVYVGHNESQEATFAWGPHVPSAQLEAGPFGRSDGQPLAFYLDPVPLTVGGASGAMVRPNWTLFSRRGRGIAVTLEARSYLYRVTGFSRPSLERGDRSTVAALGGVTGDHAISESADPVDVVVALVLFAGVPVSAITAQA